MRQSSGYQNLPITLDQLRSLANRFLSYSSFGMTIICIMTAFFGHQNVAITFGISLTATVVAILAIKIYKQDLPARIIVSVTLAVQVMMLIFSASNLDASHVQEAHMLYFVLIVTSCHMLAGVRSFFTMQWSSYIM